MGIIVTLLVCMAQRLASSMRPTTYASAASCRHKIALPLKCKLYLPTSRAILWTNHEKGSFLMRCLVPFWNCQISQRATVPGQYFLVFFTLPALRNSFWGALPPMVGQSFLLTGSSLPNVDGLASKAIWANCQVGDDDGAPKIQRYIEEGVQRVQGADGEGGKHILAFSNRQRKVVSEPGVTEFCNKFCKCFFSFEIYSLPSPM